MANCSNSSSNESRRRFEGAIYPDLDKMIIPTEFVKYWQGQIKTGSCFVTDPGNNTISLAIELDDDNFAIITHGMRKISEFYGLNDKHHAYFKYAGNNDFFIRVCNLDGEEIDYPLAGSDIQINDPFLDELLPNQTVMQTIDESIEISSDEDDTPHTNSPTNSWTVEVNDLACLKKNAMGIPARMVSQFFINDQQTILIEDESKISHNCKLLRYLKRRDTKCSIGGHNWYKFCKEIGIKKGDAMQFTVAEDSRKIMVKIIRG